MKIIPVVVTASCLFLAGCAFDVIRVKQEPAVLDTTQACDDAFVLSETIKVAPMGGYERELQSATHWRCVGKIAQGGVFRTRDQILTAEASNIYEADLVVSGNQIVGFFLPVESTFSPLKKPHALIVR
jgi:hypothetical protein